MAWHIPAIVRWDALRTTTTRIWGSFRRNRLFLPTIVTIPVLAVSGGIGGYLAWDATRVDVPLVVGVAWPQGATALDDLGLAVHAGEVADDTIDPSCYVVSKQDVPAGTRVVPDDTLVSLEFAPDTRPVPAVAEMPIAEARESLLAECFHMELLPTWCVSEDFSGGEAALALDELSGETGFTFNPSTGRLYNENLVPKEDWAVCDQVQSASTLHESASSVSLAITVPLTTVPQPTGIDLTQTLAAFENTADNCELGYSIVATFASDPNAISGEPMPSLQETGAWQVAGLTPSIGHAALCNSSVRVEVVWPSTPMPQLIGLHHVPEAAIPATPATTAIEAALLNAECTGRGTVTSQVPAAGTPVPRGTAVTCIAELLVPNLIGLDPTSANAVLAAAGLSGWSSGSGIVVTQSPSAGTIVASTSTQSVSYQAEQPKASTGSAYYKNCTAARAAGSAPLYRGDSGYRAGLDRDGDGVACE